MEDRFVVGVGAELDPGDVRSHPATCIYVINVHKARVTLPINSITRT